MSNLEISGKAIDVKQSTQELIEELAQEIKVCQGVYPDLKDCPLLIGAVMGKTEIGRKMITWYDDSRHDIHIALFFKIVDCFVDGDREETYSYYNEIYDDLFGGLMFGERAETF